MKYTQHLKSIMKRPGAPQGVQKTWCPEHVTIAVKDVWRYESLHASWCRYDRHYSNVIMIAMASQVTGVLIVCSAVCSGARQKNPSKFSVTGLCEGNRPVTGGFPSQRPITRKCFHLTTPPWVGMDSHEHTQERASVIFVVTFQHSILISHKGLRWVGYF